MYDLPLGQVEQDPRYWWLSVLLCLKKIEGKLATKDLCGIGVTGQHVSPAFMDKESRPLRRAMIWMDKRAVGEAELLTKKLGGLSRVYKLTGVRMGYGFVPAKVLWFKKNEPLLYKRMKRFPLQSGDFIAFKLCDSFEADLSTISNSGMLDIRDRRYAAEILDELDIETDAVPLPVSPSEPIGMASRKICSLLGKLRDIPVVSAGGDVPCSALGSGVSKPGEATVIMGTACNLVVCTDDFLLDPKMRFAYMIHTDDKYRLLFAPSSGGGSTILWVTNVLSQIFETKIDPRSIDDMAARSPPGCKGVLFLPYLSGEQSPYWDPLLRGAFFGLDMSTRASDLLRSLLEGVALNLAYRLSLLESLGINVRTLRVCGGGAKSSVWMKILANATNKAIEVTSVREVGSAGAAVCAGVATGLFDFNNGVDRFIQLRKVIEPDPNATQVYQELLEKYEEASSMLIELTKRNRAI